MTINSMRYARAPSAEDATPQRYSHQLSFFKLPLDNVVPPVVRRVKPHCYLTVKPEAARKLKTGKTPLDNRIGPADVVQVQWTKGRLHQAFDRLVQAVGPSWNDLVEFARVLDDSLKATTEREEVETQQDRLHKAQELWRQKIEGMRPRLKRLAQVMSDDAASYVALLDRIERVCLTATLEEFEYALKEEFARDKEQFRVAFAQMMTLDEVDRRYAQALLDTHSYLAALEGVPDGDALTAELDLLRARFGLETFCKQPSQAGAVLEEFARWRQSYSTLSNTLSRVSQAACELDGTAQKARTQG